MTPPEIEPAVHRQLGELVAGMHGLQGSFRRQEEASRRSEDKSDASRAAMHRRLDELFERVGALEGAMAAVKDDVAEVKPVADEVKRWKLMGLGALGATGIVFMGLGFTFADVIKRLGALLFQR